MHSKKNKKIVADLGLRETSNPTSAHWYINYKRMRQRERERARDRL
uniref:Uncharacterized protein n=1 Tax=Rhizophora mucronata TaxID=61149 RepID=A0A2P2LCT1_RHIMU